jgi:hypothetical protein
MGKTIALRSLESTSKVSTSYSARQKPHGRRETTLNGLWRPFLAKKVISKIGNLSEDRRSNAEGAEKSTARNRCATSDGDARRVGGGRWPFWELVIEG